MSCRKLDQWGESQLHAVLEETLAQMILSLRRSS